MAASQDESEYLSDEVIVSGITSIAAYFIPSIPVVLCALTFFNV